LGLTFKAVFDLKIPAGCPASFYSIFSFLKIERRRLSAIKRSETIACQFKDNQNKGSLFPEREEIHYA